MNKTLENQQIVIAGGNSGIGAALAEKLAAAKASVVVTGRNPEKGKALEQKLPGVRVVSLDGGDRKAMDNFFSGLGTIDHLVICISGASGGGLFASLDLNDLRKGFENKFWIHLNTIQAALPYLRKDGSITLVTAASSSLELPGTAGLAAINGALELMVPILAKELRPLRINAVSPGVIDTPWWDSLPAESKKQVFSDIAGKSYVGRVGHAEEVAGLIKTVIETGYINAVTIPCHGGLE